MILIDKSKARSKLHGNDAEKLDLQKSEGVWGRDLPWITQEARSESAKQYTMDKHISEKLKKNKPSKMIVHGIQ